MNSVFRQIDVVKINTSNGGIVRPIDPQAQAHTVSHGSKAFDISSNQSCHFEYDACSLFEDNAFDHFAETAKPFVSIVSDPPVASCDHVEVIPHEHPQYASGCLPVVANSTFDQSTESISEAIVVQKNKFRKCL